MRKSLFTVGVAVSVALISGPVAMAADNNARNLYLKQAEKPSQQVNTGVTYWLELDRDGQKSRVSNKTAFQDKDNVKIHLKANIDGYAYVVMMQGSNGDKAVLFPDEKIAKENKIKANKEIVLPSGDNSFSFDETPGLETIRVIVSRKEIDPKKELVEQGTVMIASANSQQPDKVPNGTLVSIIIPPTMQIAQRGGSRNLCLQPDSKPQAQGETTVVTTETAKPLSIDIVLNHQKKN